MTTFLDPGLRHAIIDAWRSTSTLHTGFPDTQDGMATARAGLLQEMLEALYDETKFRGLDRQEQESIGRVLEAIERHRYEMSSRWLRLDGDDPGGPQR